MSYECSAKELVNAIMSYDKTIILVHLHMAKYLLRLLT